MAGGYSGEIQVWNFNSDSDPLIASSGVGSYHGHRDRISSVNWIAGSHLDSRTSRSNFYVLSTGSIKYLKKFCNYMFTKKFYTIAHAWSKTSLNAEGEGGVGACQNTCKKGHFYFKKILIKWSLVINSQTNFSL